MEVSGRTSVGTSVVAGLNVPLGEDLKVGDGLDAYSRLGGLCGGETEARARASLGQSL